MEKKNIAETKNNSATKQRSSFTGKLGFILAAAGSAVGLGNLWRFPYLAAQYGGGIFLLVYLILAVTFGFDAFTDAIVPAPIPTEAQLSAKKRTANFVFCFFIFFLLIFSSSS